MEKPTAMPTLARLGGICAPARHDGRQTLRALGPDDVLELRERQFQDVSVKKEQRGERLVLRRGAHARLYGEARKEGVDLGLAHLPGMALAVEQYEAADPADVR